MTAVPRSNLASELELAACHQLNPSSLSFLFKGPGPSTFAGRSLAVGSVALRLEVRRSVNFLSDRCCLLTLKCKAHKDYTVEAAEFIA